MRVSLFRTSIRSGSLLFAGLLSMAAWAGKAPDDVAAGQTLYLNTCGGCHSVDTDRIGPRHRNVVGRAVASVQGYDYSPALKKLGGIWTPARLDQWLSGTQNMAPGSKMYIELDDPDVRRSIITYLQSVSLRAPKNSRTASPSRHWRKRQ
ncbi:c-type cytochrome [Rhodanobacter sp. FDAARGOS 1247]|uniref:c-type cytochrome n=1 Tax=Rhodanobacter sp. FDAARGOS 1247 TaxID=2778082 RepID=UPI00194DEE57|nr:c-type cytochrome [Rhodanobacter sp. FDAARGOS 1247]QRP65017.1 c-type cytochrome [Rhodanobacter sp. FDAARGOS 1247]